MVTVETRTGQFVLYSKGYGENNVFGRANSDTDEFKLVQKQTARTSFPKVFLFQNVAFATDQTARLWVIGGKLPVNDEEIFPRDLDSECF